MTVIVVVVVWALGVAFCVGALIEDARVRHLRTRDLAVCLIWPLVYPILRFLYWWQWGKAGINGPLRRLDDTPWWSRGDPT